MNTLCKTDKEVRDRIFEITLDEDIPVIFPTSYPEAYVGCYTDEEGRVGTVYSEDRIIQQLMIFMKGEEGDQDLYTMAKEFFDYNIAGAAFSDYAPVLYIRTHI